MWSVSLYELKWDMRKKKVFFAIGLVSFIIIGVAVLYKSFFTGSGFHQGDLWDLLVQSVTNDFISGLFPLMLGVLVSADTIAWEYDRGTILPLFSQPLSRGEIYAGKLLEKTILVILLSVLFVLLSVIIAEIMAGNQQYVDWSPFVALGFALEVMVFVSLGFLFGSIIKTPGFLVVFILILFFGLLFGGIIIESRIGIPLWTAFIPLANVNLIQGTLGTYYRHPGGSITVNYNVGGVSGHSSLPVYPLLTDTVTGVILSVTAFLIIGYLIFRRMEVKG